MKTAAALSILVLLLPTANASCFLAFSDSAGDTTYPVPGPYDILSGNVSSDGLYLNWTLQLATLDNSSSSASYWLNLNARGVSHAILCTLATSRSWISSPAQCNLCRIDAPPESAAGTCARVADLNGTTEAGFLHVVAPYGVLGISANDAIDDMTVFSAIAVDSGCLDTYVECGLRQWVNVQPPQDTVDLRESNIEVCGVPPAELLWVAPTVTSAPRQSPSISMGMLALALAISAIASAVAVRRGANR